MARRAPGSAAASAAIAVSRPRPGSAVVSVGAGVAGRPSATSTASATSAAIARYVVSFPPLTVNTPDGPRTISCSRDALPASPVRPDAMSGRMPAQALTTSDATSARGGERGVHRLEQILDVGRRGADLVGARRGLRVGGPDNRVRARGQHEHHPPIDGGQQRHRAAVADAFGGNGRDARPCCPARWPLCRRRPRAGGPCRPMGRSR